MPRTGAHPPRLQPQPKRTRQQPVGQVIIEKERQAANLMRMAASMQADAMRLWAEIALLSEERNSP